MLQDLHTQIVGLRRYAFLLCRNQSDADDLVQETLTKAIEAADSFQRDRALRPWLFGILHNAYFSSQRRYARQARAASFLETHFGEASAAGGQEQHVEAHDTLQMLDRLTPGQQAAVILVGVEGLSYEEAAQALGVPIGTVMSRLARGREALRRLVAGEIRGQLKVVR